MAIYNCEDTLAEAIDSLYQQSCQAFKLILCDDCSTDKTWEIASLYADRYDNIVLIRNEKNLKLAASLNHCLQYADTEFVARMDGDDISLPQRFEKQLGFLEAHPEYAIVSSPMIYFDEDGDWGRGKCIAEPDKYSFRFGVPHPHAPSMIRTEALKKVNGYQDDEKSVRVEDYYLWYKLYKAGFKGYNLDEPLYKMRDNKVAMNRRNFKARMNGFTARRTVLKDFGICCPLWYAMPNLIKAFVPDFIIMRCRRFFINRVSEN